MTNNKIAWIALGIAVLAFLGTFIKAASPIVSKSFGAAGGLLAENYWPYLMYNDGYKSEKNIELSGANGDITTGDDLTVGDDATVSGGNLTVTTSNTATSTTSVGCIQTTATSTATPIRFLIHSTTTPSTISGIASGYVAWGYGSCPI